MRILARKDVYEKGRAILTVFNWERMPTVRFEPAGLIAPGAGYEVRNVQDFYGPPVASGTWNGGSIRVPMIGLAAVKPVGWPSPQPTGPEFAVFVLTSREAQPQPQPVTVKTP